MKKTVTLEEARRNKEALNTFIMENEALVHKCMNMAYVHRDERDYEDMLQVGRMAMLNSIKKYSPEGGATFSTYATTVIYMSILHYKRELGNYNGIRMPKWYRKLVVMQNKGVPEEEIMKELGLSKKNILKAITVGNSVALDSTPATISSVDYERELVDILESSTNIEHDVIDKVFLEQICDHLTPDEQLIFHLRTTYDFSQQEIANYTGGRLHQVKISRMLKKIKEKVGREIEYAKAVC